LNAQGRVWFGEFAANKVAMFDPDKETFRASPPEKSGGDLLLRAASHGYSRWRPQ